MCKHSHRLVSERDREREREGGREGGREGETQPTEADSACITTFEPLAFREYLDVDIVDQTRLDCGQTEPLRNKNDVHTHVLCIDYVICGPGQGAHGTTHVKVS